MSGGFSWSWTMPSISSLEKCLGHRTAKSWIAIAKMKEKLQDLLMPLVRCSLMTWHASGCRAPGMDHCRAFVKCVLQFGFAPLLRCSVAALRCSVAALRCSTAPLPRSAAPLLRCRAPLLRCRAPLLRCSVAPLPRSVAPLLRCRAPLLHCSVAPLPRSVAPLLRCRAPLLHCSVAPLPRSVAPLPRSVAPLPRSVAPLLDCFGTYLKNVQTCDNVRVQSATQWTASVHTSHMSKPVITFVFKVLRNGLLRCILYTCPNL